MLCFFLLQALGLICCWLFVEERIGRPQRLAFPKLHYLCLCPLLKKIVAKVTMNLKFTEQPPPKRTVVVS